MGREFSDGTKKLVADLSANICNNPGCLRLCAGPSNAHGVDRKYIGEVAHIIDKATINSSSTTIRLIENCPDETVQHPDNALFLCPNCHELIDKNRGQEYPASLLHEWKRTHYSLIHECLVNKYSLAGRLKSSSVLASTFDPLMNKCQNMAALVDDPRLENWNGVVESFEELRSIASDLISRFNFSKDIKKALEGLALIGRVVRREVFFDNPGCMSSHREEIAIATLMLARKQVGTELIALSDLTGCRIPASILHIVPSLPVRTLK